MMDEPVSMKVTPSMGPKRIMGDNSSKEVVDKLFTRYNNREL